MSEIKSSLLAPRIWQVGALCRAIADALEARFNPVAVRGEISGFSRASSGHCYFSLKDESGQIRCAMFRRAASLMDFSPRDGELVEVRGRLGVYEPRGDLQLIVESMSRAGQGALFEQFLRLKAKLEGEGLFDSARKRPLPVMPRGIGLVTSLGAAALHDVVTALQRRVPHIPVVLAPASVQGNSAPQELNQALLNLYHLTQEGRGLQADFANKSKKKASDADPVIDVILLVRGGGSMEDLWAFNDEQLARTLAASPVPVISGVGHETDFTIADFTADLRAPTPSAAAELLAPDAAELRRYFEATARTLETRVLTVLDHHERVLELTAKGTLRHEPERFLTEAEQRVDDAERAHGPGPVGTEDPGALYAGGRTRHAARPRHDGDAFRVPHGGVHHRGFQAQRQGAEAARAQPAPVVPLCRLCPGQGGAGA